MSPSLSRLALAFLVALGLGTALAVPAHASTDDAEVVVVHAVQGLTVDVYVNGDLALPDFVPGTITEALPFPAGTYDIVIVAAGGDPATPAIAGSATVAAGDRVTLVAHLAADGTPTLTPFVDDLSLADKGEGRLIVRHVAAAPAVDVKLERRVWRWRRTVGVLEDLENGQQTAIDVRARRYFASILPANSANAVFGPAGVRVKRGQATIVYAFGDLAGGTFDLLVENRRLVSETALLTVAHGVLGLTVDVYVNGDLTLPNFEPRTITEPLPLPHGDYEVVIVGAGGDPASPAIQGSFTLEAGIDYTLVAHLAADGTPTLSPFVNNLAPAGFKARLTARHTAAAPAVDVRLTGRFFWFRYLAGVLRNIANGGEASTTIRGGHYEASITPAGDAHTVVLGPAPLNLHPGRAYFVYAIGSLADGTLDLLVDVRYLR
ncbi:MAG: DUF4397 domain-containing protein [Planctomycetota bacterium]|nr:DUF4397 domain-containing protein [Planctomycetota bacterium]